MQFNNLILLLDLQLLLCVNFIKKTFALKSYF